MTTETVDAPPPAAEALHLRLVEDVVQPTDERSSDADAGSTDRAA